MAKGILRITDGETSVNLLSIGSGIRLRSWRPGRLGLKQGGYWFDPVLADFRQMVDYRWTNIIDTFTYQMIGQCGDDTIYWSQEADRLLIQAIEYFRSGWQTKPVYLEKRGTEETNTSYALIKGFGLPQDNDPFPTGPFFSFLHHTYEDMDLGIEHGPWMSLPPSQSAAVPMGTFECFNLLLNGSFEDWTIGVPDDWAGVNTPVADQNVNNLVLGAYSLHMDNTAGADRGYSQLIQPLTPGETYTLTASVYVVSGTAILRGATGIGEVYQVDTGKQTGRVNLSVEITLGGSTGFTVSVLTDTTTGGEVYFDDVRLCQFYQDVNLNKYSWIPWESSDDCYVDTNATSINLTGILLRVGDGGLPDYHIGIRFRNVEIPQGATINSAKVRLLCGNTDAFGAVGARIYGEDNSTPAIFTTFANFNGRVRTTAFVDWTTDANWQDSEIHETSDISTVVQEIVNRTDWVSGNDMVIFIQEQSTAPTNYHEGHSHDNPDAWPRLIVEYDDAEVGIPTRDETTDPIYVANGHGYTPINEVFYTLSGATARGENLAYLNPPYPLTEPGITTAVDAVYFGVRTGLPNDAPFSSIVFDLQRGFSAATLTITWQYWNGAWVNLPSPRRTDTTNLDGNNPLTNTGVCSLHFWPPSDWATTSITATTGWWIRALITYTGTLVPAIQQNRPIYTVTTPYVEIQADEIGGDITALAKTIAGQLNWGAETNGIGSTTGLRLGVRSVSRGEHFTPYLNLSDELDIGYITVAESSTYLSFVDRNTAHTGRGVFWNNTSGSARDCVDDITITIAKAQAKEYWGKYHAFVRWHDPVAGPSNFVGTTFKLATNYGFETDCQDASINDGAGSVTGNEEWVLHDFGIIDIPGGSLVADDQYSDLEITLSVGGPNGDQAYIMDLILMPVDELALYSFTREALTGLGATSSVGRDDIEDYEVLSVDSVSDLRRIHRTRELELSSSNVIALWNHNANGAWHLSPNERLRIWFLAVDGYGLVSLINSMPTSCFFVTTEAVQRYTGQRGKR